ncbi:MAG TPA: TlpA disulfide reductase family protein [Tepidisphaeraceae bacterium]|nr:TlpA disulfide reductase family protein [Tepidisphaeraceae bacterium]
MAKDVPAASPREQLRGLIREFDEDAARYAEAMAAATTDDEREAARAARRGPEGFTHRFLFLARKHPSDPAGVDALIWIASHDPAGPEGHEAMERLARDHAAHPGLGPACSKVRGLPVEPVESFLRAVLRVTPHRDVRAGATYSLAMILKRWADDAPELADPTTPRARQLATYFGEPLAKRIRTDPGAIQAEAEALFGRLRDRYADVPADDDSADGAGRQLGHIAERTLYEMRHLTVGRPAPELAGEDLDGVPVRLSDHRGRVVVVTFWATWCPPCMTLVPHERALAERLAGLPFTILGVNGDEDRGDARRAAARERMTWRSCWAGGPDGEVVRQWNVHAWPTVYVIDGGGVIRHKWTRAPEPEALTAAVDRLLR